LEISASLDKHKYAFAIPCYEGKIQTETTLSLLDTSGRFSNLRIPHSFLIIRGGALIHDVRNELVHRFLHLTDCDTLICIDADIQWDWDALLRLLVMSENYPIVAGCYPSRVDPVKFIVNNTTDRLNEHGLLECDGIGMGFVAIQRQVFEKMKVPAYEHSKYDKPVKAFFQLGLQKRENDKIAKPVGEDVWFFREAYKQGFPCMVDPAISLIHHGSKAYDYQFKDYVKEILNLEDPTLGDKNGV